MREWMDFVRELSRGAFGEARNAGAAARSWALYFAIAVGAGLFMAMAGPFGTYSAPLAARAPFWIGAMLAGSVFGQAARLGLRRALREAAAPWPAAGAIALAVAAPGTLVVWALMRWLMPQAPATPLPLFLPVLAVSAAMTGIFVLTGMTRGARTQAGPQPARFLERMPPALRGGALFAVQAEDHYLRLHTSRGQALILMRLADAIAELDGLEGRQIHRSWWVARDGFDGTKRDQGKVLLTLKNGVLAPVSRPNVAALREASWI